MSGDAEADLVRELAKAADRRQVMIDLDAGIANGLRDFVWLPDVPPADAAAGVRDLLGVGLAEQMAWRNNGEALSGWVNALNVHGVLVFHMSRISKARVGGASVYSDPLPFMLLNGADTPAVRIFTLAHELGHLAARSGGICNLWNNRTVEQRCNEFAAAFLMPSEAFLDSLGRDEPLVSLPRLAREFNVSYSAAAVRLRTLRLIEQVTLDEQLEVSARMAKAIDEAAAAKKTSGGPPFHRVHARNLGRLYLGTVLDALDEDRVSFSDATVYLESKLPTIDKMRDDLLSPKGVSVEVLA